MEAHTTSAPIHHDAPRRAHALLQAAAQAARGDDDERALSLLRESVHVHHFNPMAHYLLGAQLAQQRQFGDAVLHLTTAVDQAPHMPVARLQLGLLWLTQANPAAALAQLQALCDLPEGQALRHFGEALSCLCRDDLAGAERHLSTGLVIGCENAPLLADMQRLLGAVQARGTPLPETPLPAHDAAQVTHGMAILAYAGGTHT